MSLLASYLGQCQCCCNASYSLVSGAWLLSCDFHSRQSFCKVCLCSFSLKTHCKLGELDRTPTTSFLVLGFESMIASFQATLSTLGSVVRPLVVHPSKTLFVPDASRRPLPTPQCPVGVTQGNSSQGRCSLVRKTAELVVKQSVGRQQREFASYGCGAILGPSLTILWVMLKKPPQLYLPNALPHGPRGVTRLIPMAGKPKRNQNSSKYTSPKS